jgi:putative hydrolase of the HAD superfamily
VLLVLPERDDAEAAAEELLDAGWGPCEVHPERLAGDDDPEAVEWVVTLSTAPDGSPANDHRASLDVLADEYEGFTTGWEQ